jgi:hypothetical protein
VEEVFIEIKKGGGGDDVGALGAISLSMLSPSWCATRQQHLNEYHPIAVSAGAARHPTRDTAGSTRHDRRSTPKRQ